MRDIDIVKAARSEKRLTSGDFIRAMVKDFMEFHGDRLFGEDRAVISGIGRIDDMAVTVIGIEKGRTTEERIAHNFGSAMPEGYRKALRLMKQAEKFKRPVLCFVDTAGAYCGIDAEERGQGRAIAQCLFEMSDLKTPILSIVIGEGGSGGALALSHADRIWMLEDAYFSVVSPESCANILWKTTEKADAAAEALGLTAKKLYELDLIDRVIKSNDIEGLSKQIVHEFRELKKLPAPELVERRYERFRKVGY
ncbi:MAG: acetyl-CoA carboxylase carboxyl transferase subunit alpha [Lachnospiraceae bacterium]|nr:acetyl-CoA carboxylase carboxyl transferase subunit alpha [Lachnospiraceae bacterium]